MITAATDASADNTDVPADSADVSADSRDRIEDFLARHGGAGVRPARSATLDAGMRGWSEQYAADGYALRCDWSRTGGRDEMSFSEVPP